MSVSAPQPQPGGIDPRSPRFGAGITAVLLLIVIVLGFFGASASTTATIGERVTDPAFILLVLVSALFLWGAVAGVKRHPYGAIYRALVRPRLAPPTELEDPRPPTFAQLIGFIVTVIGVVLTVLGVPYAVVIFAALAFVAAFLNSVFGYCIGCQMYLLIVRTRTRGSVA
jgi:hypothetical protein